MTTPVDELVQEPASARAVVVACAVVFMSTLFVFARSVAFDFLFWDDDIGVTQNVHVQALTLENLRWMFTDFARALRYQPLSWLAWAFGAALFGLEPAGFHAMNVVLHAVCGVLLLLVLRRLARDTCGIVVTPANLAFVVVATLLWTLHPMRAEVVGWVTGLRYILVTQLLLGSALVDPGFSRERQHGAFRGRQMAAVALFVASLLTYPVGLEWPIVVLVVDVATWRQSSVEPFPWRAALTARAPFFLLSAFFLAINLSGRFFAPGEWQAAASLESFSLTLRVLQASAALVVTVAHTLFPISLSPVYAGLYDRTATDPLLWAAAVAVSLTAVLVVTVARRRDFSWPLACALAYVSLMMTKLGWTETPFSPSDRYAHLASLVVPVVFLCASRSWMVAKSEPHVQRTGRLVTRASAAVVAVVAFVTVAQLEIWRDTETLLDEVVTQLEPHRFSSLYLARLGQFREMQNDTRGAHDAYSRALQVAPENDVARYARAVVSARLGLVDEALADAEQLLSGLTAANDRLAIVHLIRSFGRLERAEAALRVSLAAHPDHLASWQALEEILTERGDKNSAREARAHIDALVSALNRIPEAAQMPNARE